MKNEHDVQKMFSSSRGAKLWEVMYPEHPSTFDQYIFSSRRDDAVDYVIKHHEKEQLILDLGCGAGPFVSKIITQGYHCLATDYSMDILQLAQKKLKILKPDENILTQSDSQHVPFADASFDAVICLGMISYVPNRSQAIYEAMRILKPGGTLYITFRNYYNPIIFDPANWLRALIKNKSVKVYAEKPNEFLPGSFLRPNYVVKMLENAGFNIKTKKGIGRGPFKFNSKTFLPDTISIGLDRIIGYCLKLFRLESLLLGADIVIYVCHKPPSPSLKTSSKEKALNPG